MEVIEKDSLRWYYEKEFPSTLFPSCSTVVGWKEKLFGRWAGRKAGDAANCGTGIHWQIEKYLWDKYHIGNPAKMQFPNISIWNMTFEERKYKLNRSMQMFFEFLKDYPNFKPLLNEVQLARGGNRKRFAGRLDFYGYVENKNDLWLLDWKTGGIWPEYDYQLAGYDILLSESVDVDKVGILYLDANLNRNPSNKYYLKVYNKEERIKNRIEFENLIQDYYLNDPISIVFAEEYREY